MARKALKSISISGAGSTLTGGVVEANILGGESVETDPIAAYGDAYFTNVPRNIKQQNDITVQFLAEGGLSNGAPAKIPTGAIVETTLTYTYGDGTGTGDVTDTLTRNMVVVSCEGSSVAVDGERKATYTVVLRPHAAPPSSSSSSSN